MAFFEDIRNYLPIVQRDAPVQLVGECYVVISGHKGIKKFRDDEITFLYRKRALTICGSNLKIIYLSRTEAYVQGDIKGVTFDD